MSNPIFYYANLNKRGVSLLEISLALTIIGLLITAVLGGLVLMRTAKMQKLIEEFSEINSYVQSFRDNHLNYLPGDLPLAHTYWTLDMVHKSCGTLTANITDIDGNGDHFVGHSIVTTTVPHNFKGELSKLPNCLQHSGTHSVNEYALAWCHLYLDGFNINQGEFNLNSTLNGEAINIPTPQSKAFRGGFIIFASAIGVASNPVIGDGTQPLQSYNAVGLSGISPTGGELQFSLDHNGGAIQAGDKLLFIPSLPPRVSYLIDLKIDDGLPASGNFRAYNTTGANNTNCVIPKNGKPNGGYNQYLVGQFTNDNFHYNTDTTSNAACLPHYLIVDK